MESSERPASAKSSRGWIYALALGLLVLIGGYLAYSAINGPAAAKASAVKDAQQILVKYVPEFKPDDYRAEAPEKSADGNYWRVKFLKIAGNGKEEYVANVPTEAGQDAEYFDARHVPPKTVPSKK